jgi:TrmH family RNA methyltransferase
MWAEEMPPRRGILEQVAQWPNPHVIVALNGVHDPQNVGLIIRNCAAFRVAVVIVDGKTHEPFYRKVVRVSMGAVFHQPLAYEPDLVPALRLLKEKYGTRIIVTSHKPPAVPLSQADLSGNICFVLGNEAAGIDPGIAKLAAMTVTIPFASERIESLNVASASAVCLFEAQRVRDCPASR